MFEVMQLEDKQIDIWLCSIECLNLDAHKDELLKLLNKQELERYHRFVFDKDKHVFLASRYLLRRLLSAYHPVVAPEEWNFLFNKNGKPSISEQQLNSGLHFNLSHSRNNIVLAFSYNEFLGVDIESCIRDSDLSKLARYSFSEKEFTQIKELSKEDFRDRFFSLWTLKEAYMKADGRGMSLQLKSFSFEFDKDNKKLAGFESEHDQPGDNWLFWQYETDLDSFISLALRSESRDRDEYEVRFQKIVGLDLFNQTTLPLRDLATSFI